MINGARARLALQSDSYLKWIVDSFRAREWPWVDSARQVLQGRNSTAASVAAVATSQNDDGEELQLQLQASTGAYGVELKRCARERDLEGGKQLHTHIVESGYARDSYVANLLIQMYAKCGRVDLSRLVFDAMLRPDLFSWNMLMSAYAHNGQPHEALRAFKLMEARGVQPDAFVFATVLGVLARCGQLDEARRVFDGMGAARDAASWSAMISAYMRAGDAREALKLLSVMDNEGVSATRLTHVSALAACGAVGDLLRGTQVYHRFLAEGHQPDMVVHSALLNLHSKCGSLEEAEQVFAAMPSRDVAACTSMMEAYARHGGGESAILVYTHMLHHGQCPDAVTYVALLGACAVAGDARLGAGVHRWLYAAGLTGNLKVQTALLHMYGKCGSVEEAQRVFDSMAVRDLICWNAMLRAHARHEHFDNAWGLYQHMLEQGVLPDVVTYGTMLTACCSFQALEHGRHIHRCMAVRNDLRLHVEMHTLLLNMYGKCGSIEEARRVFERMPQLSLTCCNAMLVWYNRYGMPGEAYALFNSGMMLRGMTPDVVTCIGALTACSALGYLADGRAVHAKMVAEQLPPDVVMWTSLVNMYAKCGGVAEARSSFEAMQVRNVVSFNTMIAAYAQHGGVSDAEALYHRMACDGLDADCITLLCLLIACNHAGLDEHSREVFVALRDDYDILAILDHFHCLVDLLSRVGRLQEAEEVLRLMPYEPGAVGWKSLLNGCAVHGDAERGARAAINACGLDPGDSSHFVLLSNVYAWFGKHDDVLEVIRSMELALDRYDQGLCHFTYL